MKKYDDKNDKCHKFINADDKIQCNVCTLVKHFNRIVGKSKTIV